MIPNPTSKSTAHRMVKSLLLLPVIGCIMALASCEGDGSLPGIEVTADTTPIGDGLKVIGYAILGTSVVIVIGRTLK